MWYDYNKYDPFYGVEKTILQEIEKERRKQEESDERWVAIQACRKYEEEQDKARRAKG